MMTLRKIAAAYLLVMVSSTAVAQESHYQRAMRSDADNANYGVVGMGEGNNSGMTSGIYWSRVRDADDRMIIHETKEDTLMRRKEFIRLCELAYDAYEAKNDSNTVAFGDSALHYGFHTPELVFFMAVSYERLGDYKNARRSYRHAIDVGYPHAALAYKQFKQRQKERKKSAN